MYKHEMELSMQEIELILQFLKNEILIMPAWYRLFA